MAKIIATTEFYNIIVVRALYYDKVNFNSFSFIFCLPHVRKIIFFSIRLFFHGYWLFTGQQGKGQGHLLFHCTTSTTSKSFIFYLQLCMWDDYHLSLITSLVFTRLLRTFRHLFAFFHARWLWHIDDVMLLFVCLLDDLILQSVS